MAENVTLAPVTTFTNDSSAVATVNANYQIIANAFLDCLGRSGASPNSMQYNLDMNSFNIVNLPAPGTLNSPLRVADIVAPGTQFSTGVISGNNVWTGQNSFSHTPISLTTSGLVGVNTSNPGSTSAAAGFPLFATGAGNGGLDVGGVLVLNAEQQSYYAFGAFASSAYFAAAAAGQRGWGAGLDGNGNYTIFYTNDSFLTVGGIGISLQSAAVLLEQQVFISAKGAGLLQNTTANSAGTNSIILTNAGTLSSAGTIAAYEASVGAGGTATLSMTAQGGTTPQGFLSTGLGMTGGLNFITTAGNISFAPAGSLILNAPTGQSIFLQINGVNFASTNALYSMDLTVGTPSSGSVLRLPNNYSISSLNAAGSLTVPLLFFDASNQLRLGLTPNVVVGSGAIATSATTGFFYIPTCVGAPTGVPSISNPGLVPMVYDTFNHKFWIYDTAWKGTVLS